MNLDRLSALSDDARLWIYPAERPLSPSEQTELRDVLDRFCMGWASHGRPVRGAAEVLYDRFLVIAAEIPGGDISGCGIDASSEIVRKTGQGLGIEWLSSLVVFYRDGDGVRALPRPAFRGLVRDGSVSGRTPVFDLGIGTLGELRAGRFERPASETWHARVFGLQEAAA